jgi:Na+/proline symporter
MAGAIVLAVFAVAAVGGMEALVEGVRALPAPADPLGFVPPLEASGDDFWSSALAMFLVLVTVQWWSSKNADGGAVVVQRMAASRDERQALLATLWFQVANYALRPWPWILAALASLLLYPALDDPEIAYPRMMMDLLPSGLRGMMLASLVAAFMSTIVSYINLSAAYLVNDVYRRFVARDRSERHYVFVSRVASALAVVLGGTIAWFADSISDLFKFLLEFGAGIGLVYIARWFWWRVNAWSEIAAMAASSSLTLLLRGAPMLGGPTLTFPQVVLLNVLGSTLAWVAVTFLTRPTPMPRLAEFYRRVRPPGWWGPVRAALGDEAGPATESGGALLLWAVGTTFVYAALFGTGKVLLGESAIGAALLALAAATGAWLWRNLSRERVARLLG